MVVVVVDGIVVVVVGRTVDGMIGLPQVFSTIKSDSICPYLLKSTKIT